MLFLRKAKSARVAADRAILRFVHGLQLVMDGGMTPIGGSPKDRVFKQGKLEVWRYRLPEAEEADLGHDTMVLEPSLFPVPVLLVPPLMVRPYVYDLRPEHSMVRALRRAGFDVFVVDFGVPDREDETVRQDTYVLEYMPQAIAAVRAATGRPDVSLVGYCMGGIFALLYTAAWRDPDVRNIVTVGAPIDFSKMGLVTWLAKLASSQAGFLADKIGNIPGQLNSQALKMMAPVKRITRYADLFLNLWNEEYVRGFESMNRWANDFIPYPRDAFKQLMTDFFQENGLVQGMRFGDKSADLRTIECPVLALAGKDDEIATPASARAIRDLCASEDFEYVEVPGGHIGVIGGKSARPFVWDKISSWLRPRSALR